MRVHGQKQIADVFGVTPKTIGEWQNAGFPVAERGGDNKASEYETAECIDWLKQREVAKASGPELPQDRLWRIQGDRLALELEKEMRSLVPVAKVEPMMERAVEALAAALADEVEQTMVLLDGTVDRRGRELVLRQAFDAFLRRQARWRPAQAPST